MKDVTFKVSNDQLKGTMFYPRILKNKNPGALIIHGWTSSRNRYIDQSELLNKLGIICLTVDLRGHGESDGNIKTQTRQEFLDDVLAAYDFLARDSRVDVNNITVIGSSFGAYLGSLLTSYRETKNLVLRVPANYPEFKKAYNELVYDWLKDKIND